MVQLTLTNRKQAASVHQVSIDIATGICTLDSKTKVILPELLQNTAFEHPLLTEPAPPLSETQYHYEYDDLDGLLGAPIFVYSALLHASDPSSCQFKINPSSRFQRHRCEKEQLYFSIYASKKARTALTITSLETLVSHLGGYAFTFLDEVMIDDVFGLDDLPATVDGDGLYQHDAELVSFLKNTSVLSDFELRYLQPDIGFGVFNRRAIKKDERVFMYGGIKVASALSNYRYAFKPASDSLHMFLDARTQGNLGRFVNHAPNPDKVHQTSFLEANIDSTYCTSNGIAFVIYTANRDLLPGEQLLVDYGEDFFKEQPVTRFKANGRLPWRFKYGWQHHRQKLLQLKIMAKHGVQDAANYLYFRLLIIMVIFFLGIKGIEWL